jgi:excisionase family DNA binding protein
VRKGANTSYSPGDWPATAAPDVPRLALTIPEAASALGISERHLRTMLSELPHCRIGGRVVLPVDALHEWLRRQAQAEQQGAEAVAREIAESLAGDQ